VVQLIKGDACGWSVSWGNAVGISERDVYVRVLESVQAEL